MSDLALGSHVVVRALPERTVAERLGRLARTAGGGLLLTLLVAGGTGSETQRQPDKQPDRHGHGTCVIRATPGWSGNYFLDGSASAARSARLHFMIDTGASEVVLPRDVAERLGLRNLVFDRPASTANGTAYGAHATLHTLTIGGLTLSDFPVMVDGGDLGGPLLGMTFLSRLRAVEIEADRMTLFC